MKFALVSLQSSSPYSQSRHYGEAEAPKEPKESNDHYEQRTWRYRMHTNTEGFVEIPGIGLCNAIKESAKRLGIKVPGRGSTLYTKFFEAGIMIDGNLPLPIKAADVIGQALFVPADGKKGGGKRVMKTFALIPAWRGEFLVSIFDDIIPEEVFEQVLRGAGVLVGIGRFRPERGGFYGRFTVKNIHWTYDDSIVMHSDADTEDTNDDDA